MDFALIEKHPWITGGVVVGGGLILFLAMRKPSSSAGSTTQYAASPTTDPNAVQASIATQQIQASLAGLQLQGATQISLAQIGADVSKFSTGTQADAVNRQTDAQVTLGVASLQAQIAQTQINADLTSKYIDAIVAAFRGTSNGGNAAPYQPPVIVQTPNNNTSAPTNQITPAMPVYIPTPTGTGGNPPITTGDVNPHTVVPGGTLLVPYPSYEQCDPRDSACVARNQGKNISWEDAVINAQTTNNQNQCMANAAMNVGEPNYAALVAACGGSMPTTPTPTPYTPPPPRTTPVMFHDDSPRRNSVLL